MTLIIGSVSALDISVWSDLYPLFHTPDAEKALTSGIPGNIQTGTCLWCLRLETSSTY